MNNMFVVPSTQSAPRSEKVGRGKAAATIQLGEAAHDVLAGSDYAMTLRQLFYGLVAIGQIAKTDAGYHKLGRVVRNLREDGTIPWDWLVDHTRSVFQPRTWNGLEDLLTDSARLYRRDLMRQQRVVIQLWAESDSIGSVINQVADRYTIPTFIGRGYSARGYLWSAAEDAVDAHEAGKTVHILHVGDFDPSGIDIYRDVEETLRLYAFAQINGTSVKDVRGDDPNEIMSETDWFKFERLALTPDQIDLHQLPSAPPKRSDVRTAKFTGSGTVEVEAMPVEALLGLVEAAIVDRIDLGALEIIEQAEHSERDIARRIAATPLERLVEASA